ASGCSGTHFGTAKQGRREIPCLPAGSHERSRRPVLWERVGFLPCCSPLSVPTLRRIGVLQLKRIQCARVAAETRTHTLVDEVLQNIEVEIDQRGIFMRLLQAAWVMGNWKTVDRIRKHWPENCLGLADLWNKDVDWPHGIAAVGAKLHQEHFAADELVDFAALASTVIASCELRPDVCLFLNFAGYLDVGGVISLKNAFQSHGQSIPRKHFAVLGYTSEIYPPPALAPLLIDTLLHSLEQTLE